MDIYRRRSLKPALAQQAKTKSFDPFKPGTKRLKAGYKRLGNGVIEEIATGTKQQF